MIFKNKKIVHIMVLDKFIPPYIDFINRYFDKKRHEFIIWGKPRFEYGLTPEHKVTWIDSKIKVFNLLKSLYMSDKIILHGLWKERVIQLLLIQPWLIKKCYWVMWGGDFYFPEIHSRQKKILIKNLKHFVTIVEGDYEYIKENYQAGGFLHECFCYPSNAINESILQFAKYYLNILSKSNINRTINILVGNSATKYNNHLEIFEKLYSYSNEKIKIFVPLTYGDMKYAQEIIEIGRNMFGDKFIPLREHMPYEDYLKFLSNIDIAIFAHNRQQALGNIIALLGMGKKVFLKSSTTHWKLFQKLDVKVFDLEGGIDLTFITKETAKTNSEKMAKYFSIENLVKQWKKIFDN